MRTLFEYIAPFEKEFVGKPEIVKEFNLSTTVLSTNLKDKLSRIAEEYVDGVKDDCVKALEKYIEDYPTKRSEFQRGRGGEVSVTLFLLSENDKLVHEVVRELGRIGVYTGEEFEDDSSKWYPKTGRAFLHGGIGLPLGEIQVTCHTKSKQAFAKGEYNFDVTNTIHNFTFNKTEYGNGYNHLPAEDMTILRQKLYDCIKDIRCTIYRIPDGAAVRIKLVAIYDKSKLKALLTELRSDKRLQHFADVMDEVGTGIQDYYASKGPGDYVGD